MTEVWSQDAGAYPLLQGVNPPLESVRLPASVQTLDEFKVWLGEQIVAGDQRAIQRFENDLAKVETIIGESSPRTARDWQNVKKQLTDGIMEKRAALLQPPVLPPGDELEFLFRRYQRDQLTPGPQPSIITSAG